MSAQQLFRLEEGAMARKPRKSAKEKPEADVQTSDSPPARESAIAVAAYFKAEARGFEPGRELQDWLEAEREIDRGAAP